MARPPRLDFPGARHHVMNRASRREAFFRNDAVCAMFVDLLEEVPVLFGARIHGYALMPNHYHLMVEVPRGNLSEVMRHVGARFTQQYNRQAGTDGPLFRGRYKNRVVQDDAYWIHLLAYLHLNPVRGRLVKRAEDCIWTSHRAYIGAAVEPEWLTTSELLGLLGSRDDVAAYVDAVRKRRQEAPDGFDEERLWSPAPSAEVPERPEPPPLRTADEALAEVAEVLGTDVDGLLTRENRGPKTDWSSWVAVWWLLRATDLTQREVGRLVDASRTRVSQLRQQAYQAWRTVPEAKAAMQTLEDRLASPAA